MKQVHITLQGKGGIGKSYVTALVAQNLMDRGEEVSASIPIPLTRLCLALRLLKPSAWISCRITASKKAVSTR